MRVLRWVRELSVARQILLLQGLVVGVLVLVSLTLAAVDARSDARDAATERAVAVALAVADSPTVVDAVQQPDPSATLQPYAERVRFDADVDFVVVMGLDRTRYTHPTPDNIGKPFIGDLGDAPEGGVFTQEYEGTLGPSMRAVVPVLRGRRRGRPRLGRHHHRLDRPAAARRRRPRAAGGARPSWWPGCSAPGW